VTEDSKIPLPTRNSSEMRAAGIAHDLNNVLTVVSGYAEMLREDLSGNQPLRENAEKILSAVKRARSLTAKLLVSGKVQGDDKTVVDLNDIVAETIGFFRPSLPPGINVVTGFYPGRISILADPSELLRVFMNITGNAALAMGNRGGTLSVETSISEKGDTGKDTGGPCGRMGVVIISDTGCGMDQVTLGKIFTPGFTSRADGSGKGLGLYVSGEIINSLGGTISVSSSEGKGSAFTVSLPLFNTG